MAFENSAGINVNNHYGVRSTGGSVGVETDKDSVHQLSIAFTGKSLNESFLPPVYIPKGALFLRYRLRVDEAFGLTGTTPTVIFGGTVPGTNGVTITEAELETIGTKVPASDGQGTWDVASTTGTTASERITKTLGGTSPVVDPTIGKATLIAEYLFKTKV
jgi:hypothetical protein